MAEKEILSEHAVEIARIVGANVIIIEPGSGAGEKIRLLIPNLKRPKAYIPIEISKEILYRMTNEFFEEFSALEVIPVCADFTQDINLPEKILHRITGHKILF